VLQRILCRFSLWDPANRNGKTWTNESHEENRLHGFSSSSNLSVTFCENSSKGGFVLDIIIIFTTNFYNHFLHLKIGLMFSSEHMNNNIKGDTCFWIGSHFRHGFDFDQTFPPQPFSFSLWFYFSMSTLRALFTGSISTLTFSLLDFTLLLLDNPFPLWLWESLVRLPWFVWHQSASRNLPVPW